MFSFLAILLAILYVPSLLIARFWGYQKGFMDGTDKAFKESLKATRELLKEKGII